MSKPDAPERILASFRPAQSGVRVQETLRSDAVPPPPILLHESQVDLGSEDIDVEQYISREWHDLEMEYVWRKVWQVACREEELPEVGDSLVYDIGEDSLIVVRSAPGEIRAFHNACLHRGTQLRVEPGKVSRFRCPFHGFTWELDGTLSVVPSEWDFPTLRRDQWRLPEARVGTWGGFVFVNLDPDCEPLESYLEILPEHLACFGLEQRYKAVHVSQIVPCNWKVALEAFFEGFHVDTTHAQSVGNYDTAVQYDVYPGVRHVSRLIQLGASASPQMRERLSEKDVLDRMQRFMPPEMKEDLADGEQARAATGRSWRRMFSTNLGVDLSHLSDSEILDNIEYFIFPNVVPWPTVNAPITYRFRPNGHDPDSSLFEVMFLHPRPERGEAVIGEEIRLEPGQLWASVEALGGFGPVFDQDMPNLARIQRGLHATRKRGVTLARYQESRLRHFHETLKAYIRVGAASAR